MDSPGRTPEELDLLLEDAFVMRDPGALAALFAKDAVLADGPSLPARGRIAIVRRARAMWDEHRGYMAGPTQVLQSGATALVVSGAGIHVVRRGRDGGWRYAIAYVPPDDRITRGGKMTTPTHTAPPPTRVAREGGEARWWFAALAVIKAGAADTGGRMAIVEVTEPPGAEAPLHVHHREDEAFWVLEGDVTLRVGDRTIEAHAGDYVFGPRDIPHSYRVGPGGCRMLFICVPGGFEDLVRDMSLPAAARTLPPPSDEAPDMERIAAIARDHGCELLG